MKIIRIRNQNDWEQVRDICCLTGKGGDAISKERWPFFSEEWVGPYQSLLPQWTYIAISCPKSDLVLGYLTGCSNTQNFECRKWPFFSLPLFFRSYFFKKNGDIDRYRKRFLRKDKGPEQCFSQATQDILEKKFPAHLHMNFREEARGLGLGKKIADRYFSDLKSEKVQGCHLFCGPAPLPFYLKLGFREIEKIEFRPGVWVYCLGIEL